MAAASVKIYVTTVCPYCVRAKMHLTKKGVTYSEINVDHDSETRTWLMKTTGQRTVPQIFINDQSIGGCDDMLALDRAGKLDPLLAQPPA
jgi:glutaredoxin 3